MSQLKPTKVPFIAFIEECFGSASGNGDAISCVHFDVGNITVYCSGSARQPSSNVIKSSFSQLNHHCRCQRTLFQTACRYRSVYPCLSRQINMSLSFVGINPRPWPYSNCNSCLISGVFIYNYKF